jgi:hypothetical protein
VCVCVCVRVLYYVDMCVNMCACVVTVSCFLSWLSWHLTHWLVF